MTCRHLVQAEGAVRLGADQETPTQVRLCSWGETAPPQLMNVPRWMQRNALSGHLWQPGDCEGCPVFNPHS